MKMLSKSQEHRQVLEILRSDMLVLFSLPSFFNNQGLLQNENSAAGLFSFFGYSCHHISAEKLFSFCSLGYRKADPAENGSVKPGKLILFSSGCVNFRKMGLQTILFPLHPQLFQIKA